MCGRFCIPESDVSEISGSTAVKNGEVFPGDKVAVIASNRRLQPQVFTMEWGYRLSNGKRIINARSETAGQKIMFADGIYQRRCLIPAQCYFEWDHSKDKRLKYAIGLKNGNRFYLAGIYRIENGTPVFSILTRAAASSIAFIHDRMPVILPESAMADWLNPRKRGKDILNSVITDVIFKPCE